jgi:predicted acylesterase/phospholipase RssA
MAGKTTQLRISLTISGAVALGAYEGGALAALLHAVRPLVGGDDAPVRLDAIGAASAGSITGMLAARTLLEGLDPVEVMRGAWVDADGIGNLRARDSAAPLSVQKMRSMATSLMDPPGPRSDARQHTPVQVSFTLAALRGLDYTLPALRAVQPVAATTYVDYYTAELTPGMPVESLASPAGSSLVDAALASSANALGFPPYLIDRTLDRQRVPDPYASVQNWPESSTLWYTDGGTLDNEPLGRTLDLTNPLDVGSSDYTRLQVLVHPHPTGSPKGDAWASIAEPPTWLETLTRSIELQRAQSLFGDLKQVEKTNSRLAWATDLTAALGQALDALPAAEQHAVRAALTDVLARMRAQRDALRQGSTTAASAEPERVHVVDSLTALLAEAVGIAANVGGKTATAVEVISPLLLPEARTNTVEKMLSGEFLGHFGGFFDRRLRLADFDLGYTSTLCWLASGGLAADGRLAPEAAQQALGAATAAYQPLEAWKQYGGTTFRDLSIGDKLQAVRLAGHVLRVVAADLFRGGRQR